MGFILFCWWLIRLILAVVLIIKFWRVCDVIEELNRTVGFMRNDIKDLRDSAKINKTE